MIDWNLVVDWDAGNERKSTNKHLVDREEAEQVFADPKVLVVADERHSETETRFHALGVTIAGRELQVSFTLRENGRKIGVISARPMNRKERMLYGQET